MGNRIRQRKKQQKLAKRLWRKLSKKCFFCGNELRSDDMTKDHFFPKSEGYKSLYRNMVPSCHDCNQNKGDRFPDIFEILRACELYESVGFVFCPVIADEGSKEPSFEEFRDVFKEAGLCRINAEDIFGYGN